MKSDFYNKCKECIKSDNVNRLENILNKHSHCYFNPSIFLHQALCKSDKLFEFLLKRGANPNHHKDEYPILLPAVKRENISKICLLLKYGARPEYLSEHFLCETNFPMLGMLNLLDCSEGDAYFIINAFQSCGNNINQRKNRHFTILDALVTQTVCGRFRRSNVVNVWNAFVRNGACTYNYSNPSKQFQRKETIKSINEVEEIYMQKMIVFDLIAENKVGDAMEYVRNKDVYINAVDCRNFAKDNILTAILRLNNPDNSCFVRELLDMGVDTNYMTYTKETAYTIADNKTKKMLFEYGANTNTDGCYWKLNF